MRPSFFSLLVVGFVLGVAPGAMAQKIIEKNAPIAKGQRVVLNLPQGNAIRIRAGVGKALAVKASVDINQNKLNDALQLTLTSTTDAVTLKSELNEEMLKNSPANDCPENGPRTYSNWSNGKKGYSICTNITYEITVPDGVDLTVSTISSSIDVQGPTGALDAKSISGDVNVKGATAAIKAKSISGAVDVSWPAAKGAELAMKTITGEVYTDQDIVFQNKRDKPGPVGYQLRGTLNGTGPLVQLESISNDVYFRKTK
ncbi:DUF4097 family beta strand repeat-containing protein [Hymenobacter cavernae]|uniref:DUF4097 domain-containing protein n=1 Tax=Hymenobacter cavernae TaxID=2044852 RepID=A0ABQ1TU73_9BACT|nr:DUF4097 family beta strand repeat-containing protein [Hymenobacter cavernae]GGF03168.1 hypothetical protein GCM10011383_12650 [Hymenobacter cavernae]